MADENEFKILLKNVPIDFDKETIELVFENKRNVGPGDHSIAKIEEINFIQREQTRDVVIQYENQESVRLLIQKGQVKYKEFEFKPLEYSAIETVEVNSTEHIEPNVKSEQIESNKTSCQATFEINEIYKFPFYLFEINREFWNDFEKVLMSIKAKVRSIENDKIIIETSDDELLCEPEKVLEWKNNLAHFLDNYFKQYFEFFEFNDTNYLNWTQIRDKAIECVSNSPNLNLIYRNKPQHFLRVEGQRDSVHQLKESLSNFYSMIQVTLV
ncbi:unnamed protein product [Brachionus calyciflorus]|uniref:Uncharacterized protein n=1 Tax=Brachionus calyciflorus TaxID=104777 RepID=A0A813N6G9_9BILA|nr:unnamed protein product [Brachionus calyciflorus]